MVFIHRTPQRVDHGTGAVSMNLGAGNVVSDELVISHGLVEVLVNPGFGMVDGIIKSRLGNAKPNGAGTEEEERVDGMVVPKGRVALAGEPVLFFDFDVTPGHRAGRVSVHAEG